MTVPNALRLPAVFSSHMVLQRDRANPIWGWDCPGTRVQVKLGVQVLEAVAAADGVWRTYLPALPAGGPLTLEITGSSTQVLEDVLVGEVWLASGQSNMEWSNLQAAHPDKELPAAQHPRLRLLRIPNTPAWEPATDVAARWTPCTPETAEGFSAVAYHFGRELQESLDVPVGLIQSAWGGTRVEAWTSEEALRKVMHLEGDLARFPRNEAELDSVKAGFEAAAHAWEMSYLPADPGNEGEAQGWARSDFDDTAWREIWLPCMWQTQGMRFNGVVWFRRTVELPAGWQGRPLRLELGILDDFDHTYVNGTAVGSHPKGTVAAYKIRRSYAVPATLVQGPQLTIAVRVFDHFGQGGFAGPVDALRLFPEDAPDQALALAGSWRCEVEHRIELLGPEIFRTYPPQPHALESQNRPAALYNGMIAPLVSYGLRGAIWYQGESNAEEYHLYGDRFRAMIRDWRDRWGQGTFPFLFVQLANFIASPAWPRLREVQAQVAASEPGVALAVTIDIGNPVDIHPTNKREVGRRLALLARADVYGEVLLARGPEMAEVQIQGSRASVRFRHAENLRGADGRAPRGFTVAGADRVFVPAQADVTGPVVHLQAPGVVQVQAVRYADADAPEASLVNAAGLPAVPFRTDGW